MARNLFVFRDKDVIVAVPRHYKDVNNRYPIIVKLKDEDPLLVCKRLIINFAIYYTKNGTDHLLKTIRPYFELWVGYRSGEENHKLKYYDYNIGNNGEWVTMIHSKAKKTHTIEDKHYEGYGYRKIYDWGDPNVGWV